MLSFFEKLKFMNILILFFFEISLNETKKIDYPNKIMLPNNYEEDCKFYNPDKLKPLVENYLASKEYICMKLKLCPKIPKWAKIKNLNILDLEKVTLANFNLIPNFQDGKPLHVFLKLYVLNISTVDLYQMTFGINYLTELSWFIPSNICQEYYNSLNEKQLVEINQTKIDIPNNLIKFFWIPDIFITNSLKTIKQQNPIDTRFLHLNIENKFDNLSYCYMIFRSKNYDLASCHMDFHVFPFDEQICPIRFKSFKYPNDSVILHWELMDWYHDLYIPGYSISFDNNKTISEKWFNENYSILYVEFIINRQIVNLLTGPYFTTFLIILTILSTFWLSSLLIGDRLNMGLVSVLALNDQFRNLKKILPSIGYMNPLSYWIIFCMLFVFAQLFQNSFYYYIILNKKKIKRKNKKSVNYLEDIHDKKIKEKKFLETFLNTQIDENSSDYIPIKFDLISRLVFCVLIIFFLAIYWPISMKLSYIYNSKNEPLS